MSIPLPQYLYSGIPVNEQLMQINTNQVGGSSPLSDFFTCHFYYLKIMLGKSPLM